MRNTIKTPIMSDVLKTGFSAAVKTPADVPLNKKYFYGYKFHKETFLYPDLSAIFIPSEMVRLEKDYPELLESKDLFVTDFLNIQGNPSSFAIFGVELGVDEVIVDAETNDVSFKIKDTTVQRLTYALSNIPHHLSKSFENELAADVVYAFEKL